MTVSKGEMQMIESIIQRKVEAIVTLEVGVTNSKIDKIGDQMTELNIKLLGDGKYSKKGWMEEISIRVEKMWEVYKIQKWLWGFVGVATVPSIVDVILRIKEMIK